MTTFHPDLVLPDTALFDDDLEPEDRIVLAATLGFFERRNASLTQLATATGLHRRSVIDAQRRLGAWKGDPHLDRRFPPTDEELRGVFDQLAEGLQPLPGIVGWSRTSPLVVFDRPEHAWSDSLGPPVSSLHPTRVARGAP